MAYGRRGTGARGQRGAVSHPSWVASWFQGFRDGIYAEESGNSTGFNNEAAMLRAFEGEPVEQDTRTEQKAYREGYRRAGQFKIFYKAGKFPDLENALAGGNELQRGGAAVLDQLTDFASDPFGEAADGFDMLAAAFLG